MKAEEMDMELVRKVLKMIKEGARKEYLDEDTQEEEKEGEKEEDMGSIKKVTVMSDDEEGLEEGLAKAKEILKQKLLKK